MGDDFEKAILFTFDQSGNVSDELKLQAQSMLLGVSQSNDAWRVCVTHLESSQYAEVQFWCLQTLHGIIRSEAYDTLEGGSRDMLKRALLSCAALSGGQDGQAQKLAALPTFLRNKLAQVIVAVAGREYPNSWPSFFQDIMNSLNDHPVAIDSFCRILVSIHEDIVSLEVPRSAEEARRSMGFKDAMREHALNDVARSWCHILNLFKESNPSIVASLLYAVERYVHWIDISLVANDQFMPLLFIVLESPDAEGQTAAVAVLTEIVSKRMDAGPKLSLIQSLGIVPIVSAWATSGIPGMESDDHELSVASSKLLGTLATEVLESWKKVENSVLSMQAVGLAVENDAVAEASSSCAAASNMMDLLFPALVVSFRIPDEEISSIIAPFMLSYISRIRMVFKRNPEIQGTQIVSGPVASQIIAIMEAAATNARFSDDSSVYSVSASSQEEQVVVDEEEATVAARRQDIFTLFRNAAKLVPREAYTLVARRLESSLGKSDHPPSWQDAELALSLLYQVGEGATDADLKPSAGPLAELASAVIQVNDSLAYHRLVALALLEACARYSKVALHQPDLIPLLASKFFGPAGLGHPSSSVPPRAAYLLCRVTKSLKHQMGSISREVLRALVPHLQSIASTPLGDTLGLVAAGATSQRGISGAGVSGADDRMYAFEAAGILIGSEDMEENEQREWFQTLSQPLITQITAISASRDAESIPLVQQSLEALTRISKGFSPRMCDKRHLIGQALTEPLSPAMEAIQAFPTSKYLRLKFLAYVHRLVECLGSTIVGHLSNLLWSLKQTGGDAGDFKDVLVLLNQMILKFGSEGVGDIVKTIVPECISRVYALLGQEWDWSGAEALPAMASSPAVLSPLRQGPAPVGSTEDIRERAELQKQYYTFLNSLSQSDLGDMLLNPNEASALGDLIRGASSHVDPSVRKLCIATLGKLSIHWLGKREEMEQNGALKSEGKVRSAPVAVSRTQQPNGPSDMVVLKDFVLRQFGCEVLLESLAVKTEASGVDIRDAAAISLLTEVSMQMKNVYSIGGDDYLQAACGTSIAKLGWPREIGEQLATHIVHSTPKQLKDFLKAWLLEVRR